MTMPFLSPFRSAVLLGLVFLAAAYARAEDWPPSDPGEAMAKLELDANFALSLRGVRSFRQLQEKAGAGGHITDVVLEGDAPHVVYGWIGAGGSGRMRALLYEDGGFGAIITLPAAGEIVLNSFDAFICASCSPPVNSCGHRPSWVPHDLHWDVFDCGCTLTGPQSLHSGSC